MAIVKLNGLKKVYPNGFQAVHNADLNIADGEFIVLVGPSGCGKSTLLRMIAGLENITEGDLFIGNKLVNDIDPARRDIAMVFQNYALYPHMSVFQNMAYGLRNRKFAKQDIEAAVNKAAKMLDLEPLLTRKPSQLSGGQRQRVAMGRAIVRNPSLFLFDEPLSNLDAKLRNQMRIEIRKLQRELGTTSIYVTHDQVEAMTMADRIVVLNAGNIEQIGTPEEIYHRPASTFVASFMGAPPMNLLSGKVEDKKGVMVDGVGLIESQLKSNYTGEVIIGIRPEKMKLTNTPNGITKPFHRELTEELGAARLVHGTVGNKKMIVNLHQEDVIPPGDLHVALKADTLHIFDKASGQRLN